MIPKSITLNKNKKGIQLEYEDSMFLLLNSAYLRAYSPSAENKRKLGTLKYKDYTERFGSVFIKKIESVGNYAIRIIFSDGHDTGIYSWEYLVKIGSKSKNS